MACWSSFGSPVQTEHLRCWSRSNRGLTIFRSIEHRTYKERKREVGLFSVGKRRQKENLIATYSYLKVNYCIGFAWQGFSSGGDTGVASVRSC